MNKLGFYIPENDKNYSKYFYKKSQFVVSSNFVKMLERGHFKDGEWHHLFNVNKKGEIIAPEIVMLDFVNKYYKG